MDANKKNEFEIASDYVSALAKMAADQAARLASLAAAAAPPAGKYSLGDFLLDQMQNSTKLMETLVDASKEMTRKAGAAAKSSSAATETKAKAANGRRRAARQ